MTRYAEDIPTPVAFPEQEVRDTLAETLSGAGLRQLHAAETEKYAHVTYFFNGGEEAEWEGETRVLVPSPRDVASYDLEARDVGGGRGRRGRGTRSPRATRSASSTSRTPTWSATPASSPPSSAPSRRPTPRSAGSSRRRARSAASASSPPTTATPSRCSRPTASARTPRTRPISSHSSLTEPGVELRGGGSLADLAPTVLKLLGQAIPEAMTGTAARRQLGQWESLTFQQVVNSWYASRDRLYACRALALEQPDLGILRKAQRGDERAFSIIVRAYERPIYNYVLRLVGDRALAEDLTQEVFLRVYQGLPGFSLRSRFTTWLFQVTKNRVLDELRSLERRPRSVVNIDDIAPLESIDAPFERAETIDALWRAVEALNVDLKMALLLRDIVGLSYTEIADSLEITLATVKWRIYKAREEVQAALVRDGVGVATSAAGALSTITE